MPLFNYIAIDSSGTRVKDSYRADSKQDVMKYIAMQNLYAMKIEEIGETIEKGSKGFTPFSRVNSQDLYLSCRQFYTMLHAGIGILDCLETVAQQSLNSKLRTVLMDVHSKVQTGTSFSEALSEHKDVFPTIFISMVETGEVTGNLEEVMRRLSQYFENEYKTVGQVKSAMIYPIVLFCLTIIMIVGMLTFVMPKFSEMFAASGAELPGPTKFMISLSNILVDRWYIFLGMIIAIAVAFSIIRKKREFRMGVDKLKLKLPIVKHVELIGMTFRMSRSLSIMLSSGVSLVEALDIASRVAGNYIGLSALQHVKEEISQGMSFGKSLERTKLFPNMLTAMVTIGETAGILDGILEDVADFYQEELNTSIKNLVGILEPLMIVFMAIGVGMVAVAMLLPMFNMAGTVG
ncbi:MAG: type II secretion system F family protein [Clostridia bacterium]|nr:type II secretion system F family protein [Clostridia bacterium]